MDGQTIEDFNKDMKSNLYKIWNRMSSGCYYPPPVQMVEIPKKDGGVRKLGIPTVADRIAQMTCKLIMEPKLEPCFHKDSYGYRPFKSAKQALDKARKNCWEYNWVIDLDIKGFFDNINHELMMKAVRHHVKEKWILLYTERWLKAKSQDKNGNITERDKGTPQGGVISPLLANLFLHYAFDLWMKRNHPNIPFERYADDCIVHCKTLKQAEYIKDMIAKRLGECNLELHPVKTKIVYCKDVDRQEEYVNTEFDFLGYTFKKRICKSKHGKIFENFLPAISKKASSKIKEEMKSWKIRNWTNRTIEYIANEVNSKLRGWINYYGAFFKSALYQTFHLFNCILIKWVMNKYKRFRKKRNSAFKWLECVAKGNTKMFAHWELGIKPKG